MVPTIMSAVIELAPGGASSWQCHAVFFSVTSTAHSIQYLSILEVFSLTMIMCQEQDLHFFPERVNCMRDMIIFADGFLKDIPSHDWFQLQNISKQDYGATAKWVFSVLLQLA